MDAVLTYAVTGLGFVLSALSFAVIFMGTRVAGDRKSDQELEFKGFKVRTNSVVMLLVVSVVVAVLPLLMQGWLASRLPVKTDAKEAHDASPATPPRIYITGQVLDANGPVEGATVSVTNMRALGSNETRPAIEPRVTSSSGTFDFNDLAFTAGDRYKVVVAKPNHVEQFFYIGPGGAVDVRAVLVNRKG